jgi:hypothetical protein
MEPPAGDLRQNAMPSNDQIAIVIRERLSKGTGPPVQHVRRC